MLCYLLAGVALTVALLEKSWAPVLRAGTAAVLGLGLAAFFLVPADWEQRWVAIRQAVDDPGLLIENSWLFARHADPRLELHDIELIRVSAIAVVMIAIALIGLLVIWRRRMLPPNRRWWIPLVLIPLVVLFLQFPASDFVWNTAARIAISSVPLAMASGGGSAHGYLLCFRCLAKAQSAANRCVGCVYSSFCIRGRARGNVPLPGMR